MRRFLLALLILALPSLAFGQRVPSIGPFQLRSQDQPADEEVPTYEASTGMFEWQAAGSGSGHTIQDEGVDLTARTGLNFVGAGVTCTDDAGNNQTDCSIPGGSSGNSFETIAVPAGTNPVADSSTDILTITETSPLVITGTAGTDTIDITWSSADIGADGTIQANSVALTTDTTGNYAAGDAEAGNALTGDTATAFFSVGQIEAARGGTGDDTSATTGVARIDAGNWTYSELSGDVVTSGSNATTIQANSVALTTDTTGNYAAGDAEAGNALTGDTATAFFSAGQIEAARGGTGDDTSATTGMPRIDAGNWTYPELNGDVVSAAGNATTIQANSVALTTDTTGNYVGNASTSALTGLTGGSAGSEGASLSLAWDYSATLAADPALAANACVPSTTGFICEGATANISETLITVTDPTADRTFTIPDADSNPIRPLTCGGTDKVSAIAATGVITCTTDSTGSATPGGASGDVQFNNGAGGFGGEAALNYDSAGDLLVVPSFANTEDTALRADLSPTQITADQNNYNPTNLATSTVLRLDSSQFITITGLAGGADGRVLMLVNIGTSVISLANEDAGSSAANRFAFGSTQWLGPTDGIMLVYDSTSSRWRRFGMNAVYFDINPTNGIFMADDWMGSGVTGTHGWSAPVTGTGASCQTTSSYGADATNKAVGIVECDTGTTATGHARISSSSVGLTTIVPTLGITIIAWRVAVEVLSDGTETYAVRCGMCDNTGGGDCTDGIYFEYDSTVSANWQIAAAGGGTRTKTASGTAVDTNYNWLMAITNAAWTSVDYFYRANGSATWTDLGNIADGNIPTVTELTMNYCGIEKSAGTTQRDIDIDAFLLVYQVAR